MEPEGSLPHSQASATCPYPGPAQSSPHTHIPPPGESISAFRLLFKIQKSHTYNNVFVLYLGISLIWHTAVIILNTMLIYLWYVETQEMQSD